ncbi:MAG: type IV secretion system protein VirB10 [Sandarakinorhabdus sp.]|nr:type IV secretion system protein VirB10 [Sandarakinorhabdus sp.]
MTDDTLSAADARAMPAVARPASRWLLPGGIAGVVLLGVGTFAALYRPPAGPADAAALPISTRAPTRSADLPPAPLLASAPAPVASPVFVPPQIIVTPAPVTVIAVPPAPRPTTTPALVLDLSIAPKADAAATAGVDTAGVKLSSNEAFLDRVVRQKPETVGTDRLSSTDMVIPQGSIITAVLETAINSDLPGLVRAVVSRDVRGFDGSRILIPRGSRLIGQYSNGVALGQSRAFVIWTRLLRSDGVSVQLGSAATDPLGAAGLGGKVNNHFLRRFGAATLLSVITSGLDYLVNTAQKGSSVVVGSPTQATQLAGIALQREIDIPPTIKVAQGTPVRVFVAKDLDFSPDRAAR